MFAGIRRSIFAAREKHGTRVVHFSVQGNHVHLIVEADGRAELQRGMRALGVRLARAVNTAFGLKGRLFVARYHGRALQTPLEVRRALRYVLLNSRHHARGRVPVGVLDGCSSSLWFDGWSQPDALERSLVVPHPGPERAGADPPVAAPRTWLCTVGWKRRGLIDPDDIPSVSRARPSP